MPPELRPRDGAKVKEPSSLKFDHPRNSELPKSPAMKLSFKFVSLLLNQVPSLRARLPPKEEHTLCSLSGGAVTPESQLEESTSPADTTEDDLLPLKPWGRSQSLPAYADLIMVGTSVHQESPKSNSVSSKKTSLTLGKNVLDLFKITKHLPDPILSTHSCTHLYLRWINRFCSCQQQPFAGCNAVAFWST